VLTQSNASQNAGLPSTDLELVNYGRGHAWLRPELNAAIRDAEQLDQDLTRLLAGRPELQPQPEPEETRWTITQSGRDYLARERAVVALFGSWPTLARADTAEVSAA
jgi:hypothetical protein